MTLLLISNLTRPFIFADHYFEAVSAVKLPQYVIANLSLKGLMSFCVSLAF